VRPGSAYADSLIERHLQNEMQHDGIARDQAEEQFLDSRQPSRRFVPDSSVAGPIAFLCSPHAADINGAAPPINGGWVAGR
jgi:3-hydroxybutyrate dehydrogenase